MIFNWCETHSVNTYKDLGGSLEPLCRVNENEQTLRLNYYFGFFRINHTGMNIEDCLYLNTPLLLCIKVKRSKLVQVSDNTTAGVPLSVGFDQILVTVSQIECQRLY